MSQDDPSTPNISLHSHPNQICFLADEFQEVWDKYQVKREQFKYKLEEAGLSDTGRHRYQGQRRRFFILNSYRLSRKQGMRLILENKVDLEKSKFLTDDPGYQSATHVSRAPSHDGDFSYR